jgi:hypothetical protein
MAKNATNGNGTKAVSSVLTLPGVETRPLHQTLEISSMNALSRQQLCAALAISESTVRRLELLGLPFTPVGLRAKRYDLAEVKQWLREARSF